MLSLRFEIGIIMRYFVIAGEASGDLHGGRLIRSLLSRDASAEFEFLGGDEMSSAAGVPPLIHYRDMAFMGFFEVLKHLRSILGFMRQAKSAMTKRRPDALILIDYPSFNLKVARWAHERKIPVFYFISPKVWAWKEWRVKDIKRYVDSLYSILPFEVSWYAERGYTVDYVGNPTVGEVAEARRGFLPREAFCEKWGLNASKPIIALVPGSRRKEICDNLPSMLSAARRHSDCQAVVAAAPSIDASLYGEVAGGEVPLVSGATMELVANASVALVTSGTATLETAVIGTPQVACYRMNGSKWVYRFYSKLLHGKYVTLPNLITDSPVIAELLLHRCTADTIDAHLTPLLSADSAERCEMLSGYNRMMAALGDSDCTNEAARRIVAALVGK